MANEQEERLRDAFAQLLLAQGTAGAEKLLAGGTPEAVPMEAVWARQGLDQLKPPPPANDMQRSPVFGDNNIVPLELARPQGYGGDDVRAPMPQVQSTDPTLDFPTGTPPGQMKGAAVPFPGAKEIEVKPYNLPKSPGKKQKKDKG